MLFVINNPSHSVLVRVVFKIIELFYSTKGSRSKLLVMKKVFGDCAKDFLHLCCRVTRTLLHYRYDVISSRQVKVRLLLG